MKLSYEQFDALARWVEAGASAAASIAQHPNDRQRVERERLEVDCLREDLRRLLEETDQERRARELV